MQPSMSVFQFSRYNIIFVVFCIILRRYLPDGVIDVARGIALFVFVGTFFVQLVYGISTLADICGAKLSTPPTLAEWVIFTIGNVLWHALPLFLIGLPRRIISIAIAWLIMLIWYNIFRKYIRDIYSESISARGYDTLMYGIVPGFAVLIYLVARYAKRLKDRQRAKM